jgi:hypothetical protein
VLGVRTWALTESIAGARSCFLRGSYAICDFHRLAVRSSLSIPVVDQREAGCTEKTSDRPECISTGDQMELPSIFRAGPASPRPACASCIAQPPRRASSPATASRRATTNRATGKAIPSSALRCRRSPTPQAVPDAPCGEAPAPVLHCGRKRTITAPADEALRTIFPA